MKCATTMFRNPYNGSYTYYNNHYLCPWVVTPDEVAGVGFWEELRAIPEWYESVICPA